MLPKQHRLTSTDEFAAVVRGGRRRAGAALVAHILETGPDRPARFGFVVSKRVGGAVQRNLVKRRLRAASFESLRSRPSGADVVVRAQPAAASADYVALRGELLRHLGIGA